MIPCSGNISCWCQCTGARGKPRARFCQAAAGNPRRPYVLAGIVFGPRKSHMNSVNRYVPFLAIGLLVSGDAGRAQTACPEDTLWEPYAEVCAPVRDVRSAFLPLIDKTAAVHSDAPVPGTMSAGTACRRVSRSG